MARVIDELITRYVLDDKKYKDGADAVAEHTRRLQSAFGAAERAAKTIGFGVAAIGAGLIGLGTYAANSAIKFDTLQRSLQAITGSAERAKAILGFVDKLAVPSVFGTEDLGDAARLLEAFGLQTERYLPIVEKLGTVFGGQVEDLKQFANALGMLKAGRGGEALESLGRAGVSRLDLGAKGIKFDGSGQLISSTQETMDAVESIVNEKFGRLSDAMASGPAAKFASLFDNLGRAARTLGQGILRVTMPAIERIGQALENLLNSGAIEKIVQGFEKLFNPEKIGTAVVDALAWIMAALSKAPDMLTNFASAVRKSLDVAVTVVKAFGAAWLAVTSLNVLRNLATFVKIIYEAAKAVRAVGVAQAVLTALGGPAGALTALIAIGLGGAAYVAITEMMGDFKDPTEGMSKKETDLGKLHDDFLKKMETKKPWGEKLLDMSKAAITPTVAPIAATARNTASMVELQKRSLEMQRQVLGGGVVGGRGIAAVELFGGKPTVQRSSGTTIVGQWGRVVKELEDVVHTMVQEVAISNARRI